MANPKLRLESGSFNTLVGVLSAAQADAVDDEASSVLMQLERNSSIRSDGVVEMSLSADVVSHLLHVLNPAYGSVAEPCDLLKRLCAERDAKLERESALQKEKEARDAWLRGVCAKYASDASLSCKDIAVLINNNDLEPGMPRLKYQSVMRIVSELRQAGT